MSRGDGGTSGTAEYRVVKSRRWDCPSCGQDKKRLLATMCDTAKVERMVTLTIEQPKACLGAAAPGELPDGVRLALVAGQLVPRGWGPMGVHRIPGRHRKCDPNTHLAWNVRHGGVRWRVVPDCVHCLRWVSLAFRRWVRKVRQEWPNMTYLHVREVHKSGAVHLHVATVGIGRAVTKRSKTGIAMKRAWREVGGGSAHLGTHRGDVSGAGAGWYIGKYLAKQQDNTFAPGFRRWSRAAAFAPEVRMTWTAPEGADGGWDDPLAPLRLGGWVWPDGVERGSRYWRPTYGASEAREAGRLDTSTANCPDCSRSVLAGWLFSCFHGVSRPPLMVAPAVPSVWQLAAF